MAYKYLVLIIIGQFLFSCTSVKAASCCGGGSSMPGPMTGDHMAQINTGLSHSALTHSVDDKGEFRKLSNDKIEITESFNISIHYLLSDLWQIRFGAPFKKNTLQNKVVHETSQGIGDIKTSLMYEFLPEYFYHPFKPRGFIFFEQSFNNSKSIYEAEKPYLTDAMGSGFYTSSLGLYFFKSVESWDISVSGEYHFSRPERFENNSNNKFKVEPGDGYSLAISCGYSPIFKPDLHFGVSLSYLRENASYIFGDVVSRTLAKTIYESSLSIGHLFNSVSYSLVFSDQSFLGLGENVFTAKSITLNMLHFFDR